VGTLKQKSLVWENIKLLPFVPLYEPFENMLKNVRSNVMVLSK
jgi:hypothetical protein